MLDSLIHKVAMSLNIGMVFCIINMTGCVVESFGSGFGVASPSVSLILVFSDKNSVDIMLNRKLVRTLFASLNCNRKNHFECYGLLFANSNHISSELS